jgi:hypothetical protein
MTVNDAAAKKVKEVISELRNNLKKNNLISKIET